MSGLMEGKRGLVFGIADEGSLGWEIARALRRRGAEVAMSVQDTLQSDLDRSPSIGQATDLPILCDFGDVADIDRAFARIGERWNSLDFVVHAIGPSETATFDGALVDVPPDEFAATLHRSLYSLIAIAGRAKPLLAAGGSLLTFTSLGATKAVPGCGLVGVAMAGLEAAVRYLSVDLGTEGIRINAISAGRVAPPAATGTAVPRSTGNPLCRSVGVHEITDAVLYLVSRLASGVTGEIHHVDGGCNVVGMGTYEQLREQLRMLDVA